MDIFEELVVELPAASVAVAELAESFLTFLPWSLVTVVLLESDVVDDDCWANIAEAAINDTRMSFFMPISVAIKR